jgi:hypothetical protein
VIKRAETLPPVRRIAGLGEVKDLRHVVGTLQRADHLARLVALLLQTERADNVDLESRIVVVEELLGQLDSLRPCLVVP